MSLSVAYESVEEANMRLSGTVVKYDGEPVYISRVTEANPGDPKGDVFRVYARPLPVGRAVEDENEFRKFISSKRFDLSTIKTGFMNKDGTTYFLSRAPARQYKQGLSGNSLNVVNFFSPHAKGYHFDALLKTREFAECLRGEYPTFREALRAVQDGDAEARAFSRSFAFVADPELDGLVFLYHKTDKVGYMSGEHFVLASNFQCLRESLQELGLDTI